MAVVALSFQRLKDGGNVGDNNGRKSSAHFVECVIHSNVCDRISDKFSDAIVFKTTMNGDGIPVLRRPPPPSHEKRRGRGPFDLVRRSSSPAAPEENNHVGSGSEATENGEKRFLIIILTAILDMYIS